MEFSERSSVREVIGRYPAARAVCEKYGLNGCGGPDGPDEPIALFAHAHEVAVAQLLADLRAAAVAEPPKAAALKTRDRDDYRYYLGAAAIICVLAGAVLGTLNLTWIVSWSTSGMVPRWEWWPALLQAHGDAQLFGWTGLFIMGIASHTLPRMLHRPAPPPWLARAIFGLVFGGLVLGLFAQPLSVFPGFGPVFVAAMALQWMGVTLFAGYILRTVRRPQQPWLGFVLAGTLWFWLGAAARLFLSGVTVTAGEAALPRPENAAFLHAMSWGFLVSYVVGYSLRLLPAFAGLPEGNAGTAWTALLYLTTGAVAEIAARVAGLPGTSLVALAITLIGVAYGISALHLWAPPTAERHAVWLARFARTAYGWWVVAGMMLFCLRLSEVISPLSPLDEHAFGGAARHALTVGFISLMIVGVAWRILPNFSGAARPRPALMAAVYGLLLAGCLLRVTGQSGAGLWGGGWYAAMGMSGWFEMAGVTLFAIDVLRLVKPRAPVESFVFPRSAPAEESAR